MEGYRPFIPNLPRAQNCELLLKKMFQICLLVNIRVYSLFLLKNEDVSWTKSFVENVVLFQMSENAFYMTLE